MATNETKVHDGIKICGAKTRAGTPCQQVAGWGTDHVGTGRCKLHGGKSTGPKDKKKKSENMKGNKNSEKHGLYSKYLPEETNEIIEIIKEQEPIDLLWEQITIQAAAIIRSQKIMYVKDKDDYDIKSSSEDSMGASEDYITANEKQASFLQAQSRAMTTLNGMIKQYEEMCNSELVTETQKARLRQIQTNIKKIEKDLDTDIDKPIEIEIVSKGVDDAND